MLYKLITGLLLVCATAVVFAQDEDNKEATEPTKRPSWSAGLPERTKSAEFTKPEFKSDLGTDVEIDMSGFGLQEKPQIEIGLPINDGIAVNDESSDAIPAEPIAETVEKVTTVTSGQTDEMPADVGVVEELVDTTDLVKQEAVETELLVEQDSTLADIPDNAIEPSVTDEMLVVDEPVVDDAIVDEGVVEELVAEDAKSEELIPEETVNLPIEQSIASVEPPIEAEILDAAEAASEKVEYKWNILKQQPVQYPVKAAIDNLEGWVDVEVTINPSGQVVSTSAKKYSRRGRIFGKPAVKSVNQWLFKPPSEMGITENITRIYKIEFEL